MKHMRKALSLLLVLAMVVCFAVPAMADGTDEAVVTVYVTHDKFTMGGMDDNGNKIAQAYVGGDPAESLIDDYTVMPVDGATIATMYDGYRTGVYKAPSDLSADANILDAILCSLELSGYNGFGGWDSYTGPDGTWIPGGYIHDVRGPKNYDGTVSVTENAKTVDGVSYDCYVGYGWQIAVKNADGEYVPIEHYGTYYSITDDMEIVFDYSYYMVYDVHFEATQN